MNSAEELTAVIEEIRNAKAARFSNSAFVDKRALVERLEVIVDNLPKELQQAKGVVADRQDVLSQSHEEAEAILRQARAERDRLLARTEIVTAASREAERIIDDAKIRAREIRVEAEDYVDAKLANFEIVLQKTLTAVARGRESLRGRLEGTGPHSVLPSDSGELQAVSADPSRGRARRR